MAADSSPHPVRSTKRSTSSKCPSSRAVEAKPMTQPPWAIATRTRPSASDIGSNVSTSGCASRFALSSSFDSGDRRTTSWTAATSPMVASRTTKGIVHSWHTVRSDQRRPGQAPRGGEEHKAVVRRITGREKSSATLQHNPRSITRRISSQMPNITARMGRGRSLSVAVPDAWGDYRALDKCCYTGDPPGWTMVIEPCFRDGVEEL